MKSLFFLMCAFFAFLLTSNLQARTEVKTFMPPNNLDEYDGLLDNGMTEAKFDSLINEVQNYYAPIVKNFGATLVINHLWTDKTVNAQAYRSGNTWSVDMFGGLARRQEVTEDGFTAVICHELGHHLSGFPFVSDWAANEGQSDYFSTHACIKNIWAKHTNTVKKIDAYAKKLCDTTNQSDIHMCYREMNAGFSLAKLLAALGGTKVAFNTPDTNVVADTDNDHPNAQCRLDTYVAGTICSIKWNTNVIPQTESESANYLCTNYAVPNTARPKCWFKPAE